jgi:hypothetical protein
MRNDYCRLHVLAMGLAFGITWSLGVFLVGLGAMWLNWGNEFINLLSSLYIGYEPTLLGSFIGGILAFIDGFIGGIVFAWIYNCVSSCCCKGQKSDTIEQ